MHAQTHVCFGANATKGQVAAPPSRVIKSRRLIVAPEDRTGHRNNSDV